MDLSFSDLPISGQLASIRESLLHSNRLILQAPPGAGKTTAVPLALLNEPWIAERKIIMLEPRRLAARAAATRMAELLGEEVGMRVGYHIRAEKKFSHETRVLVITEGILTRYLQRDPDLADVALIIFDEYHERHLHSDLSLALALQSQELLRDDLKILVMSATLDTRGLNELLDNPCLLTSEGRSYPVTLSYRPASASPLDPRSLIGEVVKTALHALTSDPGDILVFLPGEREIRELESRLSEYVRQTQTDLLIAPLYGNLSREEQHRAILPSAKRKIVLATNIAETSLTIEGIRVVIDSGAERIARFDSSAGMERLITQKISRASADQRAGRAGRTAEGKCYRLWSEHVHHALPPYREAEIVLADLAPLALELAAWGASAEELRWIDPPKPSSLGHAQELLHELGALDETITPHGRAILSLGLHPRLAHMILRGRDEGLEGEAIVLAALLSERDILNSDERHSDLRERFWMLKEALIHNRRPQNLFNVLQSVRDIASRLRTTPTFAKTERADALALLLTFAYPDRIAKARGGGKFLTREGKEAYLAPHDDLVGEEWLVIARTDGNTTSARIRLCAPIALPMLREYHPQAFSLEDAVEWNPKDKRTEARRIERMGAILISSRPASDTDPDTIRKALIEGIRTHGLESLGWSDGVRALQRRLIAFRRHCPDQCAADFTDEALLDSLETWLLPHLGSQSSLRECESLAWETILLSSLPWEQQREMDRLLPSRFTAPTGSAVELDYADPDSPVLAVRIQEMFGTTDHPSVLAGKLPLSVHLLSPAHRPIQVTRDLASFWSGSYSDVKKELKGRYPKHYWPDDPATAQATKKTKKFMES
ncbi:ATP-dependent helicase HrpB [Sulfuricurvum sp. UBA5598]|uniref:ATP-dependent helicase HrpB n=1 Tax=Sulfuricurvum sp. UBA5598 TaxID=1947586 RepID=UPI0025FE6B73|nr:ATP-dependent helicase HrpB [Sulfuricurvum sp. UBA5598]